MTIFFKKVPGLSKYTRLRYVYKLVGNGKDTCLFATDLKTKFNLAETERFTTNSSCELKLLHISTRFAHATGIIIK